MTDIRPYLETGDPLKEGIRKRVPAPKLDGLTTAQRQAELDMTDTLERLNAKILADGQLWYERQRRNAA